MVALAGGQDHSESESHRRSRRCDLEECRVIHRSYWGLHTDHSAATGFFGDRKHITRRSVWVMLAEAAIGHFRSPNFEFPNMGYGARDFSITSGSRDLETPESHVAKGRKSTQYDSRLCSQRHRAGESLRLG